VLVAQITGLKLALGFVVPGPEPEFCLKNSSTTQIPGTIIFGELEPEVKIVKLFE
jgi:hypothetical protein